MNQVNEINQPSEKVQRKITLRSIIVWGLSILFLLGGLSIFTQPVTGFFLLLAGLSIFPPFWHWLKQKQNLDVSWGVKGIVCVVFLILSGSGNTTAQTANTQNAQVNQAGQTTISLEQVASTTVARSATWSENDCKVSTAKNLGTGGFPDWSPDGSKMVYHKWNNQNKYQIYMANSDGSNANCLTCKDILNGPKENQHKLNPSWHPSGKYILMQVEMDNHPIAWFSGIKILSELMINGVWTNMYAVTPDGKKWYKLTNYDNIKTDGVMYPTPSFDGRRVLWSRIVEPASEKYPWGKWRLMIANFVEQNETPKLENIQDITPENATFIEAHGFSPDGKMVTFTSDIAKGGKWSHDVYTMDIATKNVVNLTNSKFWDEHSRFSQSGKKISYMSSEKYPFDFFKTDLMMVSSDGTEKIQLTHFNEAGYPESTVKSMPTRHRWNPDGTRLAVTLQISDKYPETQVWTLQFAGQCGN